MKKITVYFFALALLFGIAGCSSPEEQAEKYYEKGMSLLEKNPDKAKLEFQNALQLKKTMVKAMYGLALASERKGDWKETFNTMSQVLEQDPNHVGALVKTAQILLAAGKLDLALERSDKALAIDKDNLDALNLRAALQLKLNDSKGAVENANLVLAKDPNNADAYMVLATERLAAKDDTKAIEYFDKVLAKNQKNLAVQLIKIIALENLSKVQEAEQQYQNVIKLFPDSNFVRKSYVQFLVRHDRKADAELQLRAIAEATPKDVQAKLDIVRFLIAAKGAETGRTELESLVKNEPGNYGLAFALVDLYQILQDSTREEILLNKIVSKAGNSDDGLRAHGLIAQKLIKQGKKLEATQLIEAILNADKNNGQALILKASLAIEDKNYGAAIADLRTVLRDKPESSGAALLLASAYESAGSIELAEEQYLRAMVTSNFSSSYGLPYTQFLLRVKEPARAEKVLEDILEANPNDADVMRELAQSKILRGDLDGAQMLADKAKNLGGKNSVADQILGAISSSKNDADGSLAAYLRAYETDPDDSKPIIAVVSTYVEAGKSKEALVFLDSVLKANPNNMDAKLLQGQVYASMGNVQKASQAFTDIIKLQPSNSSAYQQLALLQQNANQSAEAEKTVSQGLAVLPNDFELKLTQASIYESSGRFEDAIRAYEEMLKIRPDSVIASNNLASLLLDHRDNKSSINRAYDLVKTFENSQIPQLLDTYGWANYKLGKYDDAEKALKLAVDKLPEVPVFYYHLAKVYIAKNNHIQAKQALQLALEHSEFEKFDQKAEAQQLIKTL